MKVKTTVILFGIFIILLVLVYLVEGPLSERERKKAKETTSLFPSFELGNITKMEVKSTSQEVILEKKEGMWVIGNTDGFTADPSLVNSALTTVQSFTTENIASRNPNKHELFEVIPGKGVEVKVYDNAQNTIAHFYLGKTGPDFFSTYLRKEGSDEVILARGSVKSTFDKSIKNWRDKTIFDFPAEAITHFTIKTASQEIVLEKDEKGIWQMIAPEKAKVKKEEVEGITTTFASLKAIDFAEDEQLVPYQLDTPPITIKAILKDKEEKQLLIGKKHEEKSQYYVKNPAKKPVFLIGKYQVDKMNKTVQDLKEEEKKEEEQRTGEGTPASPKEEKGPPPEDPTS